MNKKQLKQFLLDSNKAGYAGGDETRQIKEEDGSTTIVFEQGDWQSHDNYFGGEPYGGRTVVLYRGKPVWMMVYYGWVKEEVKADSVYEVLRNALLKMPEDYPFRGPQEYEERDFVYSNSWKGGIERFSGEEQISQKEKIVYKANYLGGFIDQR
jgi:hypothetical protein